MWYSRRWELEDEERPLLDITVEAVKRSMVGVAEYLEFTYETGQDYQDGWLPTLDTSLYVDSNNQVLYRYFEKPTTTNTTIRMSTAMAENAKMECLSNDLVRRLLNTREDLPPEYRAEVVDKYGKKLRTSGYSLEVTRRILGNGIKGYIAKVKRRKKLGTRIHRTARESAKDRARKKLIGKSSWYKGNKDKVVEEEELTKKHGASNGAGPRSRRPQGKKIKTRAVVFVDQTPKGELAKLMREQLYKLEDMMGFRIRVVERTGRNILSNYRQTSTWKGLQCGRDECVTCHQGGEELPDCTRAGIVYESICLKCNPEAIKRGELVNVKAGAPSLYVGESSRSIQERAGEHWGAAKRGEEESHMVRHQAIEHVGEPPEFLFKVLSTHKTALNRQIKEAVRIRRRGGAGNILNSKSEYNRCHIPRLVVDKEDEEKRKQRLVMEKEKREEMKLTLDVMDKEWLEQKTRSREQGLCGKRERVPDVFEEEQRPKRARKTKFKLLEDDWGEEDTVEEESQEIIVVHKPVVDKPRAPPRRNNKRKRYSTNTPSIADYFERRMMKPIREESSEEDEWLGTQEDKEDFDELCDEYERSTAKKSRRIGDAGAQDDNSLLDNTGGSSMASWLGTEEDKEDFVRMSDDYISSTQLDREDDIKEENWKKEDDLEEGRALQDILTQQTLMLGGQEDPERSPGRGLEDGGDRRLVPGQTLSSPTTTDSSVGLTTGQSLTTVQHEDGGHGITDIWEECSFEGMVFLDVSSTEGGDGLFNIVRNSTTDTPLSTCQGGVKDDVRRTDIVKTGGYLTLTPSSVSCGEGSDSVPGVNAGKLLDNEEEQLVLEISAKEGMRKDDNGGQTRGFVQMDSSQEHEALKECDEGETVRNEETCTIVPLTPSVGLCATADTGKEYTNNILNFTCTALDVPGPRPATTPEPEHGRHQADHAGTGREVLSVDGNIVSKEPEEEPSLSQAVLIPDTVCEAGTEPCLAQDIHTEQQLERGQADQTVYGCGDSASDDIVVIPGQHNILIPSITSEAGTELCPAQGIVEHGNDEDILPDSSRGVGDDRPRPQAMLPRPDNDAEAGTELCQAGGNKGTNETTVYKDDIGTGTEGNKDMVRRRKNCKHDKKGYCSTHECVAAKLTRKIPCVVRNAEGVEVRSFKKKYYYECEVGPRGRGVLRQTRLSFSGTPSSPAMTGVGHDTRGGESSTFHFSSPTVGQQTRGDMQTAEQTGRRR